MHKDLNEIRTRIGKAFDTLNGLGVMAAEDFSCCQTCGHFELEILARGDGPDAAAAPIGHIFYHGQGAAYWKRPGPSTFITGTGPKKAGRKWPAWP